MVMVMLSPEYLESMTDNMVGLYSRAAADILADMARRLSTYNYFIPAAEWQLRKLEAMGLMRDDIINEISSITRQSKTEIKRLMREAGIETLKVDDEIYKKGGLNPTPLLASAELKQILEAGYIKTNKLFTNLTRTTANTATKQFEDALDRAHLQIISGAFDQNTAVRRAIKDLARQGIGAVRYPTGHIDTIEVAVLRATRTGVNQSCLKLQEARADEMGCDLVETSAHAGARLSHCVWQGKIFSRGESSLKYPPFSDTGYGTGAGLGGWNCRHSFYPFIDGVSTPTYTNEMLEDFEAKKYKYKGKELTEYEATQQQRYHERQIRRWKREEGAMKAAGLPMGEAAAKVSHWQNVQRNFVKETGLKRQYEREQVGKIKTVAGIARGKEATKEVRSIPKFIGRVDATDAKLVQSKIKKFERSIVKEPLEHAYVILANGKMYHFVGSESEVHPEVLKTALKGAVITHNHPQSQTDYSLSRDDLRLMVSSEANEVRGIDFKYEYSMRNAGIELEVFEVAYAKAYRKALQNTSFERYEEDFIHNVNAFLSEFLNIEYTRR